jgi:murein DD-endopeptidase MepM/ murein hydrolase activator NlpD
MIDLRWKIKVHKEEFKEWIVEFSSYLKLRSIQTASSFEHFKDLFVDILMAKRGVHQRSFLHLGMTMLIFAGIFFGPIIANDYPILGGSNKASATETASSVLHVLTSTSEIDTTTTESEKPRDQIIKYKVVGGDTLSSIAQKFQVSLDSIKWLNKDTLTSDKVLLRPGDELSIPPVTGVVHKVMSGDSIYSVAKKYGVAAQNIVNFPFNTFIDDETFALAIGSQLVVPEGVMPVEQPVYKAAVQPVTLVAGGTGQFIWPANGTITQYPVWYHLALDIANSSSPAITAADTGTIVLRECLKWGYGCHIIIDHGNGYQTLYAHMQAFYVSLGDKVNRGQSIGQMGSTGRSTGTHLHFEVRKNGVTQNPLNYLR